MRHRIAHHAVHTRGGIHLLDAIGVVQFLRGDLSGRGLFFDADRGKGKDAPGADSQHAADDALFAHAHSHQGVFVAFLLKKFHHGDVVMKSRGSAHHLVEVRRDGNHPLESFFELLGAAKIMVGKNERSRAA